MSCDLLVMPYTTQTPTSADMSPMKMFEYLASGVPFVATDFSVLREVLIDGRNAVLVAPDSAEALVEGIWRLINDPELAASIAENAKQDVYQYTWENRARKIKALVEKVNEYR
jgi:glycosyltransferase involved in cell wall biosynthesis